MSTAAAAFDEEVSELRNEIGATFIGKTLLELSDESGQQLGKARRLTSVRVRGAAHRSTVVQRPAAQPRQPQAKSTALGAPATRLPLAAADELGAAQQVRERFGVFEILDMERHYRRDEFSDDLSLWNIEQRQPAARSNAKFEFKAVHDFAGNDVRRVTIGEFDTHECRQIVVEGSVRKEVQGVRVVPELTTVAKVLPVPTSEVRGGLVAFLASVIRDLRRRWPSDVRSRGE